MSTEVRVCALDELGHGEALKVDVDGFSIAVVRIGEDVYAIGDTCTHEDYSLSEGDVDVDTREIECWRHGSRFSLVTGEVDTLPATIPEPVFDAKVVGGDIVVTVDTSSPAP